MAGLKLHLKDLEDRTLKFLDAESRMDALLCVMAYTFIAFCVISFVAVVGGFVRLLFSTAA